MYTLHVNNAHGHILLLLSFSSLFTEKISMSIEQRSFVCLCTTLQATVNVFCICNGCKRSLNTHSNTPVVKFIKRNGKHIYTYKELVLVEFSGSVIPHIPSSPACLESRTSSTSLSMGTSFYLWPILTLRANKSLRLGAAVDEDLNAPQTTALRVMGAQQPLRCDKMAIPGGGLIIFRKSLHIFSLSCAGKLKWWLSWREWRHNLSTVGDPNLFFLGILHNLDWPRSEQKDDVRNVLAKVLKGCDWRFDFKNFKVLWRPCVFLLY